MMESRILSRYGFKHNVVLLVFIFLLGCLVSGIAAADGGPDCIDCHDVTNTTTEHNVSVSFINQSDNIHARLNSNMIYIASKSGSGGNANNSICWGCHVSYGKKPSKNYNCSEANIYKCYECHNGNESALHINISGPVVKEHFKSGENITAMADAVDNSTSCVQCHNLTEMKVNGYAESDPYYNSSSLASHYGNKSGDLVALNNTSAYCMYCHNTSVAFSSTAFPVTNNSMANHSTVSNCTNSSCHAGGRIHDESLDKTDTCSGSGCHDSSTMTTHDSSLSCLHCHNNNTYKYDTGTKLYLDSYNAKTTIHSTNNISSNSNTLSPMCTECHTKTAAEIQAGYENASGGYVMMDDNSTLAPYGSNMTHSQFTVTGPNGNAFGSDPPGTDIRYARHANPNSSGGWQPDATGPPRDDPNQICINCHSTFITESAKETYFTNCKPCHNMWDIVAANYWKAKPIASHELDVPDCSDCHFPSFHGIAEDSWLNPPKLYNEVTLKSRKLEGSEHKNMTLNGNEGCLVCHTNVNFTINCTVNPININITNRSGVHTWNSNPYCTKCHALTGVSEGPTIHGHASFVDEGNNTQCLDNCHKGTVSPFTGLSPSLDRGHGHDVKPGSTGPNCISCHDQGTDVPYINVSAVRQGIHSGIQDYTSIGTGVVDEMDWKDDPINKTNLICWACHMDDGNFTAGPTSIDHADNLKFNTTPDTSDDDPYTCYDCHNSTSKPYVNAEAKWWNVTEHFFSGEELKAGVNGTSDDGSCLICHNKSFMRIESGFESSNSNYSLVSHYGKNRSDLRTWDNGNTVNCSYCHNSSGTDNFSDVMINPTSNAKVPEHSPNADKFGSVSPNCTASECHRSGWMHNVSLAKPALTTSPADSVVCLSCHGANSSGGANWTELKTGVKDKHGGTLNCSECHLYVKQDIHGIKYLQKDDIYSASNISVVDCIRCHNNGTTLNNISMDRPLVPTNSNLNFSHSEVPKNGSRWNETPSYWGSVEGACYYCHGDTKHNDSALGPIENIRVYKGVEQELNTSINKNDWWCGGCHYEKADNYNGTLWYPVPPTIVINNTGNSTAYDNASIEWFNHSISSYDDMICAACHGSLLSDNPDDRTTKELAHNAAEGAFGPDCISCHDADQMSPKINVSVLNNNSAIHSNISNYPNSTINNPYSGVSDDNKICWACHMDNASTPGPKAHADRWILNGVDPYTCCECHIPGSINNYNSNLTALAPAVYEHYCNGSDLVVNKSINSDMGSCLDCHNESEMRLKTEFDGNNSNLSLVSHYGKNRSDIRTWTADSTGTNIINCSYCHSNESSVFQSSMRNINNSDIDEHSRYGSTPSCTNSTCHGGVRMHDASLDKPDLMINGTEDSGICLSCHDSTNYSTYMSFTTPKSRHNNTLNCSECHMYEARDIHGVKYLQQDDTYSTSNSTAVDCLRCHNDGTVLNNISMVRPLVPTNSNPSFSHSQDPSNGYRWANDSVVAYWNNTNEACEYCHNDTKHKANAIGLIDKIQGSNIRNGVIDASSYWCSGCHYQAADNYNVVGNWTRIPPTIYYNNIGLVNATDDVNVNWYNHTLSDFSDISCQACHGSLLSTNPTTTEFVHNAAVGIFGPDCISCHDVSKGSPKINFNVVNDSLSIHRNISTYDSITHVDGVNDTNKICWACHMDDSQYIDQDKEAHADRLGDFNDVPVYTCDECHVDNIAATASIMPDSVLVKEHFYGGADLTAGNSTDNLTSCEVCHNLSEMKLDVNTPSGTDPEDQGNASYLIAHYGKKRGTGSDNIRTWNGGVNCSYCHQDSNSAFAISSIMVNPALNSSIPNHSNRYPSSPANNCTNINCHDGGWMHNESLTKPVGLTTNYSDGVSSSQVCLNCHGLDNYTTYTYTTGSKQRHSDTLNCTECHLYEPRDIHGVKYLQKDDTYNTSNSTAVDCIRCHNDGADLDNISMFRPLVPTNSNLNFAHSEDLDNGSRWNETSYWGSVEGACDYCHGDTKHNDSALGPIKNIRDGQELNTSIDSGDRWCVGCHLQSADSYNVTAWDPIPPTIVINNTGNSTAYDDVNVEWFNHTLRSYDDMICAACHGSLLSDNPTTKELAHNAAEGTFGPDCIRCHDANRMSPLINVSVVNSSSAIHSNISNYPNSTIDNPYSNISDDNKICWACHMDNAGTPGPKAHADRWIQNGAYPYNCSECHVNNVVTNLSDFIPVVEEHFYNGTDLVVNQNMTGNVSSCLACHNESEMRIPTEFDTNNSNLSLVSHYGKNRSDLRTWMVNGSGIEMINCSYCHQNESSVFISYMRELPNSVIDEHSRYSSTPSCTNSTCHGGERMHDVSLSKPALMEGSAEDSGICLLCHDSTNYSTYMSFTTPKSRHNNTLNCSECHLYEARDIHGVKYLQQDNTYSMSNSSVVDCYICHSSGTVDNNITMSVPKVPDENYGFSHSDAPTSGSRWNNTSYWDDSNGACEFCHNDTKHNTSAIGFISSVQDDNIRGASLDENNDSYWCSICHNSSSSYYNGNKRSPVPPTIFSNNTNNSTSWDGTDQGWYNHSSISKSNDAGCKVCHGSLLSNTPTTTEFVHNVGEGGGKYCVECHDIINTTMNKTFQIDVQAMNKSDAIHYDLNRGAIGEMNKSYSQDNVRCWACHGEGDGSDAAQPKGHPDRVNNKNPRNCSDMDCHNVNQSLFYEPMVYEHFIHVDTIDENISTKADCPACHINSVMPNQDPNPDNSANTSMVSHYGSTDDLVNTTSCIYCHLDEDNAEDWGNAPDPTTNISRLSDEELEETLFIGDKWHLGNQYFLVFNDIGVDGDSAFLRLYHNDTLLEEKVVSDVYNYTYEDDFIDPDGDEKSDVVVLELNFTAVFRGEQTSLVMVEGRSWKRIHPEDKDPACWACHMDNHTIDKKKYLVLDEDEDYIYYLEKLLDFSDEDTEDKVTLTPGNLVLREGYNQTLDVEENYVLTASEVDINGNKAYITLAKDGIVIEDSVYTEGEIVEFEYDLSYDNHNIDDFVIFTATVDSIFHGYDTDLVSLTDVKVFSDRLMAADIDDDDIKVGGYNTSQLHINDTFSIGGYPDTFHVPPLNEGLDGGSDCVRCHDVSHRFGISSVDAIQSRLGGHSQLNANATSKDNTIDYINKACWACHGTGVDPERHPADYLYPRQCQDCHTDMEAPTYGAVDISDENHGQFEDCNRCHAADYPGLHVINIFEPDIPYIVSINMSSEVVTSGETVTVKAAAMSSWNMKVKAIEYFIDVEGLPGTGTQLMPLDGTFDEQVEEVEFTIDTTGLVPGGHTMYLRAMERDNTWGPVNEAEFSIHIPVPGAEPESKRSPLLIPAIIIGIAGILLLLLRKSGYLFNLNEIPGNDSEKLLEHLEQNCGIDWAKTANIEKINNGKVVKVSDDANNLTLKLNDEKTKLYLNINGGKTDEFIVKMKDGEQKIFKKGIRYKKGII